MKRIILPILSVFITLGAAAETGHALPAARQAGTAASEEIRPAADETAAARQEQAAKDDETAAEKGRPANEAYMIPASASVTPKKQKQPRVERFLPTRKRMDREINKLKFAYKGEVMVGLTASYGTLSSDDTDIMLILDNINADGSVATVKPFIGYFYRDNNCIGVRFGYRHMGGTLDNSYFDAGEGNDLSGQLPYIDLSSDNYSFGIFHRSYAGLDPKGRFGLFAEFELALSTGTSNFAYDPDHKEGGAPNRTYSDNTQVKLSFNPGAAVYIFPNVCATISFGLGGIQYSSVTQKDADGNKVGSRKASNMRFRLNVAAINFGMTIHLWDKKKQ